MVFFDCENSDYYCHYGDSGTDACGFIARDSTPIIGGFSAGEKKKRRKRESKQPILSAELLVHVVKMTRQTFFLEYMNVAKCTASSTNWLTGCVSVDVLIKINCINFIEKSAVLRKHL